MSQLPQGWSEVRLDSISKIVTGKTPSKKDKDNFGGNIPFIKPGDILNQGYINSTVETITEKGAELVPSIPKDSITVTCIGNLGRVAITKEKSATNQQINTAIPNDKVEPKYLFHYLRIIREWMENEASATTVAIINKTKFSAAPIRLPSSKADQKRIADKLDSVLAKVEAAQARLDKIPTILKHFRQSVLASATSDELTKDWREENNVDIDNWRQSTLSDVSKCLDPNPSHRYPKADSSGVPILSTQQFVGLDSWTTDKAKLVNREFFLERKEKTKFLEDDIIFARKGRLGLARMAPKGFDYVYSHTVFIVRASGVNTDYLLWLLRQNQTVSWLLKEMNSNTGVPTLGKAIFEKLPVPLPSEQEQVAIVNKVNELFENANTVEKQYNTAKARLDKLTQSILAKAFRGELVS